MFEPIKYTRTGEGGNLCLIFPVLILKIQANDFVLKKYCPLSKIYYKTELKVSVILEFCVLNC